MVPSSPAELPSPQVIDSFPALCSIRAHAAVVCRVRGLDDQRHRLTGLLAPMLAGGWAGEQALCIHTTPDSRLSNSQWRSSRLFEVTPEHSRPANDLTQIYSL
jgi:hypothetical protein